MFLHLTEESKSLQNYIGVQNKTKIMLMTAVKGWLCWAVIGFHMSRALPSDEVLFNMNINRHYYRYIITPAYAFFCCEIFHYAFTPITSSASSVTVFISEVHKSGFTVPAWLCGRETSESNSW